jgi:hypothetical protein
MKKVARLFKEEYTAIAITLLQLCFALGTDQVKAPWQLFVFSLTSCILTSYLVDNCIELYRIRKRLETIQRHQLQSTELALRFGLEWRQYLTSEELDLFWREELTEVQIIGLLRSRQGILWSHVKTDCRFFSGNAYLKCAVNPNLPCCDCPEHSRN